MGYITVYDAGSWSAVRWDHIGIPAVLLMASAGVLLVAPRLKQRGRALFAGMVGAPFMLGVTLLVAVIELDGRATARTMLAEGRVQSVEGPVTMVHAMPAAGHDREHIRVGDRDFVFSDFETWRGFRQTASHGGPLASGVQARLSYVAGPNELGPTILKVEVVRPPSPAS